MRLDKSRSLLGVGDHVGMVPCLYVGGKGSSVRTKYIGILLKYRFFQNLLSFMDQI